MSFAEELVVLIWMCRDTRITHVASNTEGTAAEYGARPNRQQQHCALSYLE